MDLTLFKEGFVVMVIGMGTVFVFLTIMIWLINISLRKFLLIKPLAKRNLLQMTKKLHWLLQLRCTNQKE